MRYVGFCILLGCLPWMMGCEEYAHANDGSRTSPATSLVSERPKDAKKPLSFSDFPTTDPLILQAIEAKQLLIQQEEELLERLEDIRKLLGAVKVDGAKLRHSVEEFLETAKIMRAITSKALESMQALIDQTSHLQRTTKHLGSSYRAAGDLFRKKARDYSEKRLRDQLEGFAKDYEEIARTIPERLRTLQAFQKQLPALRSKARESQAFLDDVILYLSSHPGIGSNPSDDYSSQFESFAVTFSDWLRTLEELRNSLRSQAVSKVIQASYQQEQIAKAEVEAKRLEMARAEVEKRLQLEREEQAKVAEAARLAELAKQEEHARIAQLKREQEQLAKDRAELGKQRQALAEEKARTQQSLVYYRDGQSNCYYVPAQQPVITYYVSSSQPVWRRVRCR
jgi:hypothetical protein